MNNTPGKITKLETTLTPIGTLVSVVLDNNATIQRLIKNNNPDLVKELTLLHKDEKLVNTQFLMNIMDFYNEEE